ncbi:DUF1858 domain-containing protein [Mesorhizobium sp. 113-3-3]|uniref:DUF1858 domain-containing protein n=1 Tax=Mesorhizobium sp. 113-3-3 TaxID=2744516 RepID=UPI0019284085|nr:DUF1858 domain-containing protein [Mesorhizobium sp. 113-3-3]
MKRRFSDEMTMDEIMRMSPAVIRILLQNGILCVGCPIASFHTISDAAREHELDEEKLGCELRTAVDGSD